ncbi:UEV domain-containing protein [Pavlovales sp. CCMP2436]|nr:UEV domain-containing protein [Pavlovales sp. CCMP2436]
MGWFSSPATPALPPQQQPTYSPAHAAVSDALHVIDTACARLGARPYAYRERLVRDVAAVVECFPGLRPAPSPLIGWAHPLIGLHGTLPIVHRGNRYHIPVTIFLLPSYPEPSPPSPAAFGGGYAAQPSAPVVAYVTPTTSMVLKSGHARLDGSGSGLCHLAALSAWSARQSALLGVITEMATEFGQDPPMFAIQPANTGVAFAYPATVTATAVQPPQQPPQPQPTQLTVAELQGRARAIIERDAEAASEREGAERALLMNSEARGALEEWASTHASALGAQPSSNRPAASSGAPPGLGQNAPGLDLLIGPADGRSAAQLDALAEERALREALGLVAALQASGRMEAQSFVKLTRRLARELFFAQSARLAACERSAP